MEQGEDIHSGAFIVQPPPGRTIIYVTWPEEIHSENDASTWTTAVGKLQFFLHCSLRVLPGRSL